GLATEELELPGPRLADPPLHVAVLFRGHGEEHDPPGQAVERLGADQAHRGTEHPGDLRVVAAGVGGARLRIRDGMTRHDQAVELAEQRERRTVLRAARLGAPARDRESRLRLQTEPRQDLLDQPRRLELLEAELRMTPDRVTEADDALGIAVDDLAHAPLDVLSCWHVASLECFVEGC